MGFLFNGVFSKYDDAVNTLDAQIVAAAKVANLRRFEGVLFNKTSAPTVAVVSDKFEVYGRTASTLKSAVGTTAWDATATTGLTIAAASITAIVPNSMLRVGTEVVIVKTVDTTANTISVYGRGHGGTTAAIHAIGAGINVFSSAINSQDLKNTIARQEATTGYQNVMQQLFETISWDEDSQSQDRKVYGTPEVKRQEAIVRMLRQLAQTLILGRKSVGTSATPASTAGLIQQLTDTAGVGGTTRTLQNIAVGAALDETVLKSALKDATNSGTANSIIVSWKHQNFINGLSRIVGATEATDAGMMLDRRGAGGWANYYEYAGQLFEVIMDEAMPDDTVIIGDISKIKRGFRQDAQLRITEEPTLSSAEKREALRGHFGVIVENAETDFVTLTNLS